MLTPFTRLQGHAALLDRAHIDTDQIIPKQFLTRLERSGFGRCCFHDWRWQEDGSPNPAFPLNSPEAKGAAILITGENFGCGSSREHAAWALRDAGFRAILAPSFADIFAENCVNSGLLPAVITVETQQFLAERARTGRLEMTVDLEGNSILLPGHRLSFTTTPRQRHRLLNGLDPIGVTLEHESAIARFEECDR